MNHEPDIVANNIIVSLRLAFLTALSMNLAYIIIHQLPNESSHRNQPSHSDPHPMLHQFLN